MIEELLPEEKRRLHGLEHQLIELERGSKNIHPTDIYVGLNELSFRLNELDKLVQRESKVRREDFRRRVQHLRTNYNHIKSSLDDYVKKNNSNSYDAQKAELFSQANGNLGDIELEMAESGSLDRSSRAMGDYLSQGKETLSELYSQRDRLKNVQKKVFDILNYLGIANTIMKAVEKREVVDRLIVFAGMLVVMLLILCIWWFRR
jgi:Golgi SNAP receptor complex protein 2